MSDLTRLPPDLPAPINDGGADHLRGSPVPSVTLATSQGRSLDVGHLARLPTVLFLYPRTGRPESPAGPAWNAIPGARGCTPQACGFRDLHQSFATRGVRVFGVSTQTPEYQREFAARVFAPFEFLSDQHLRLARAMRLPTFEFPVESGGPTTLLKRMALFLDQGRVEQVWYPVFPPDDNAQQVLTWLRLHRPDTIEYGRATLGGV
jgi:peroxiredoxin